MNPFVSIVIPTFNHAHFLKRALNSIQEQTYTNWEVIVVDNHSTDNTQEIIDSFTNLRIKYYKIHNNGVIAASRNKGLRESNGEWIAFLDSDDWWSPDKLETCVNEITEKIDFIYHDLKIVGQKFSIINTLRSNRTRQVNKNPFLDMLINGNPISNSSVFVRKKLIDQVGFLNENIVMIGAEDFNLWLKIAKITNKFLYLSKFLGYYEYHSNGVSRKDMSECHKIAINEFLINLDLKSQSQIRAHLLYIKGSFFMNQKKTREAKIFFLQSFMFGHFTIKMKSISKIVYLYFIRGLSVIKLS
jgi:glycosyltransferase involved in cell wall biosynthesis